MNVKKLIIGAAIVGAGTLLYGALFETKKLRTERRSLWLPHWPKHLDGYQIALIADTHVRDQETFDLTQRAIDIALDSAPDMVVISGDVVAYWKRGVLDMVAEAYAELRHMGGKVICVPGNHDYFAGDPSFLEPVFDDLKILLLRNESVSIDGINWVGIDSENAGMARPSEALALANPVDPTIVIWHEPDMVDELPAGADLMLAGHSHGGQFVTPWGWAPAGSRNGRKYLSGFFPNAPTPLYVSRGIATTGPPARLFCPPEISILTLRSGQPER